MYRFYIVFSSAYSCSFWLLSIIVLLFLIVVQEPVNINVHLYPVWAYWVLVNLGHVRAEYATYGKLC